MKFDSRGEAGLIARLLRPAESFGVSRIPRAVAAVGLVAVVALLPLFIRSPYWIGVFIDILVYGTVAVSLRTILISGQYAMGHAAFMGIGAYVAGMCSRWLSWPPWLTIPLGAVAAGFVGAGFAYPFVRLRTLYYAMGSLFFGVAIINAVQAFGSVTGGYTGLTGISSLFPGTSKTPYFYFFLGLCLFSLLALWRFESCRIGLNLRAIAQSHLVASSVGIDEARYRVLAVSVGCFFVGLMGGAYAHYTGMATPASYNLMATFWLLMYVMIGGFGSFAGPITGTVILRLMPELLRDLKQYTPFVTAMILIIVVYFMPTGVVGAVKSLAKWLGAGISKAVDRFGGSSPRNSGG